MSKYTTGELATLCGTTIRTVQYYDRRDLLKPSELTEGGRRLYSEADLERMRLICTLRSFGLSIDVIGQILRAENAHEVLLTLLTEQARTLDAEISERKAQREQLTLLCRGLSAMPDYSIESVNDIAYSMKNRSNLRRTHATMLFWGIIMDFMWIGTLLLWIFTGVWVPFAIGMSLTILCGVLVTRMYYRRTAYLCPDCHAVFRPNLREFLFSAHTSKARKLTCTACGHHGFCIETHNEETIR